MLATSEQDHTFFCCQNSVGRSMVYSFWSNACASLLKLLSLLSARVVRMLNAFQSRKENSGFSEIAREVRERKNE